MKAWLKVQYDISIHAPRTGSDLRATSREPGTASHFNPRSPHGERRWKQKFRASMRFSFQSTLPARGATVQKEPRTERGNISIHAPRTGSDIAGFLCRTFLFISIHAPRTGSDNGN